MVKVPIKAHNTKNVSSLSEASGAKYKVVAPGSWEHSVEIDVHDKKSVQ